MSHWMVFLLPLSALILVLLAVLGRRRVPPAVPATPTEANIELMRTTVRIMQDVTTTSE